jgi:hypothetical protein
MDLPQPVNHAPVTVALFASALVSVGFFVQSKVGA